MCIRDRGEDQIDFGMVKVEVLHAGYTYKSSGDIAKGLSLIHIYRLKRMAGILLILTNRCVR